VRARVRALGGIPIAGAEVQVWQFDGDGLYDVQRAGRRNTARGILASAADGSFHFKSIVAEAYPIPRGGPVGRMLRSLGRHP